MAFLARCGWAEERSGNAWRLARTAHFEVYSEASGESARTAVHWLERLWAFFEQSGLELKSGRVVRVIEFGSAKSYAAYRLSATSDAFYLGTDARDYIVVATGNGSEATIAAHEYTHAQLRASGLKLPLWAGEGLADLFSTVRISDPECYLGGALPGRVQLLRQNTWMPLRDLLGVKSDAHLQSSRATAAIFYAQSWVLVQMLALSKEYAPGFHDLLSKLDSGVPAAAALQAVYGKTLDQVTADLRASVDEQRFERIRMPGVAAAQSSIEERTVARSESDAVLAELLMASGRLDRAESLYRDIVEHEPENAGAWAALGSIAMRRGDATLARTEWKRAIEYGIADAKLCLRYAEVADDAGIAEDEIRPVLERAVKLEAQFDDAHYKLALLESNSGRYAAAVRELRAMREISPERAYAYWSILSYALNELDQREEAKRAASKALEFAHTPDEREHATELAYMADTDFAVQFARDATGRLQLVTTRVPHGVAERNPFIEPGDRMQRSEGRLKAVNCGAGKATGVVVETGNGMLQLSIADASKIQMRNAPALFACGEQNPRTVVVDYAASSTGAPGLVRGIEFR